MCVGGGGKNFDFQFFFFRKMTIFWGLEIFLLKIFRVTCKLNIFLSVLISTVLFFFFFFFFFWGGGGGG